MSSFIIYHTFLVLLQIFKAFSEPCNTFLRVRSHAPSIQSHRGTKVVWPDFQPMRVPEEPLCIDLFRQNLTCLHLKYPIYVVPESVATLLPFSPIEGQKWFDQISSQWESQKNRFALNYFGKIQFLPPCIWNLPFMSTASGYCLWYVGVLHIFTDICYMESPHEIIKGRWKRETMGAGKEANVR